MGAYGLVWSRLGALIGEGSKNKAKEEHIGDQDVLCNVRQRSKTSRKSPSVIADDQRGSCAGIEGKRAVRRPELIQRTNAQTKKQTIPPKKKENAY